LRVNTPGLVVSSDHSWGSAARLPACTNTQRMTWGIGSTENDLTVPLKRQCLGGPRTWQRNDCAAAGDAAPTTGGQKRPPSRPRFNDASFISSQILRGPPLLKLKRVRKIALPFLVDGIRKKKTLGTHTFDDMSYFFGAGLAIILAGRMARVWRAVLFGGDVQIVEPGVIGRPQMEVLDDVHIGRCSATPTAFVHRQVRLRQERHRVGTTSVSFSQCPMEWPWKLGSGIGRMRAAIGIDAPQPIAVALTELSLTRPGEWSRISKAL